MPASTRTDAPIRYDAVAAGLAQVAQAWCPGKTIHAPRLGCGLAGGQWPQMEPLLQRYFVDVGIPVTIYDFPQRS